MANAIRGLSSNAESWKRVKSESKRAAIDGLIYGIIGYKIVMPVVQP